MKDLKEIWSEIPENDISQGKIDQYLTDKSSNELERFKRILKIELILSALVLLFIFSVYNKIEFSLWLVCLLLGFSACILALYALKKVKKIKPTDSIKVYISICIKFLKTYMIQFCVVSTLVLISTIGIIKFVDHAELNWLDFFWSDYGKTLLIIICSIVFFMIGYVRIFYYHRIVQLRSILKEFESDTL